MKKISIIGLGYVGLPLAVAFQKYYKIVGFDTSNKRISELRSGIENNDQFTKKKIKSCKNLIFSNNNKDIENSDIFIVTVPTPIYKNKIPNLSHLKKACEMIGKKLKKNSIIIFESTVFPGCTENFCSPILERFSNKKMNKDFFIAYSPERINVGDKKHSLKNIKKIVGASKSRILNIVVKLYSKIIRAGVYKCENIKIAEAAKAIENAQRDINIAFINEIGNIFNKINVNLTSVLKAADTKWNFLKFKPGLVGGHCIGVDPYYLTFLAKKIGFKPKLINAGRETNDRMSFDLSNIFLKKVKENFPKLSRFNILILGLSFKEDTNDIRNSKIFDLCNHLNKKGHNISVFDPLINFSIKSENFKFYNKINFRKKFHGIFYAVPHKKIKFSIKKIIHYRKKNTVMFDLKDALDNFRYKDLKIVKL